MSSRKIYEETHATRPAGIGKVETMSGGKADLRLADGKLLKAVGVGGHFGAKVGMCFTYNYKGSNYQVLQPAPAGF